MRETKPNSSTRKERAKLNNSSSPGEDAEMTTGQGMREGLNTNPEIVVELMTCQGVMDGETDAKLNTGDRRWTRPDTTVWVDAWLNNSTQKEVAKLSKGELITNPVEDAVLITNPGIVLMGQITNPGVVWGRITCPGVVVRLNSKTQEEDAKLNKPDTTVKLDAWLNSSTRKEVAKLNKGERRAAPVPSPLHSLPLYRQLWPC